jgi:hypothetical protein
VSLNSDGKLDKLPLYEWGKLRAAAPTREQVLRMRWGDANALGTILPDGVAAIDSATPIEPDIKKTWSAMCGSGVNIKLILVTVILTNGKGGPTAYDKRATCEAWINAGTDIVVEEAAGQPVVISGR